MSDSTNTNAFHISLHVKNLNESVSFYARLFGAMPTKHYPDYAKFELVNPPLVLSLEPAPEGVAPSMNHLGVRLGSMQELEVQGREIAERGLDAQFIPSVDCCYSRQTKACVTDPNGFLFEYYLVTDETQSSSVGVPQAARSSESPSRQPSASAENTTSWDHLLGSDFPSHIPSADSSLNTVSLRGTFNALSMKESWKEILGEAMRALSPGGKVILHQLIADRQMTKPLPKLPGPAARVDYTPTLDQIILAVEAAGFVDLQIERLSHAGVFSFDGTEMRELLLEARKPALQVGKQSSLKGVIYKGPYFEVQTGGVNFRRGKLQWVGATTLSAVLGSSSNDSFAVLDFAENPSEKGSCAESAVSS